MKHAWLKTVFPIAAIFSFRMLGLFMLIPVFTLYAIKLDGATPTLMGIALGAYGLSQGVLQIPFGMISDRFGRKPILTLGLILFAAGSLLGACSHSIYAMIFARALQGCGAIGSVLIALLADLTPDNSRTKAMAVIGATIGLSFTLAMIISPLITEKFGLSGIFYLTAIMAGFGLFLLHAVIPTPKKEPFHLNSDVRVRDLVTVFQNPHLQRLNAGIFCQHLILTATFFAMPLILQEQMKQGNLAEQTYFYLPLMVISFLIMMPLIIFSEKKQKIKPVFLICVALTSVSQFILAASYHHWFAVCGLMLTYFVAFNLLEASLPSLVSKQAGLEHKGTAMGIYSSSQFLGIFAGGVLAGFIYQQAGSQGIFILNAIIALVWFLITLNMKPNVYELTITLPYNVQKPDPTEALYKLQGVTRVVISPEEGLVYLRINKNTYTLGSAELIVDKR